MLRPVQEFKPIPVKGNEDTHEIYRISGSTYLRILKVVDTLPEDSNGNRNDIYWSAATCLLAIRNKKTNQPLLHEVAVERAGTDNIKPIEQMADDDIGNIVVWLINQPGMDHMNFDVWFNQIEEVFPLTKSGRDEWKKKLSQTHGAGSSTSSVQDGEKQEKK